MNDKNNYNELTVQDIRKFLNTLKAPEENLKALKEASKSFEDIDAKLYSTIEPLIPTIKRFECLSSQIIEPLIPTIKRLERLSSQIIEPLIPTIKRFECLSSQIINLINPISKMFTSYEILTSPMSSIKIPIVEEINYLRDYISSIQRFYDINITSLNNIFDTMSSISTTFEDSSFLDYISSEEVITFLSEDINDEQEIILEYSEENKVLINDAIEKIEKDITSNFENRKNNNLYIEVSAKKDELKLALSINVDNKIVDKILQLLLSSMIILNCFNINADFTLFKYENNVTNYYIDHSVYIEELNYTDEDIEDDSSSE